MSYSKGFIVLFLFDSDAKYYYSLVLDIIISGVSNTEQRRLSQQEQNWYDTALKDKT